MTKGLNEQAEAFRNRSLGGDSYPVIWMDALYEKVRYGGHVVNMAILLACGVRADGHRDVLAIELMLEESAETYGELFSKLKERGLSGVRLVVSDAHQGLVQAIERAFPGASWQRCKIHFMRNILIHVSKRAKKSVCRAPEINLASPHPRRCSKTGERAGGTVRGDLSQGD
jgi:putative transposase